MLKELFSNRLFIGALAFFVLCVVGSLLYMHHDMEKGAEELAETQEHVKQLTEKPQLQPEITAQVPIDDTSQGGHWHGDEWHAEPHDTPQVASPASRDTGEFDTSAGVDWNQITPEERKKRFRNAYYAKWGDEPSWNGEYRHVQDKKGRIRRHYRNRALLTQYEIRIGFAPPPNVLQQYQQLQVEYYSAKDAGDTPKTETLFAKMQKLVDNYQGELPARPYFYATYGKFSPEDGIPYKEDATRELYQLMGIEHLFEFYEHQFFNNNK